MSKLLKLGLQIHRSVFYSLAPEWSIKILDCPSSRRVLWRLKCANSSSARALHRNALWELPRLPSLSARRRILLPITTLDACALFLVAHPAPRPAPRWGGAEWTIFLRIYVAEWHQLLQCMLRILYTVVHKIGAAFISTITFASGLNLILLSVLHSWMNCGRSWYKTYQVASNLLPHYYIAKL